MPNKKTFLFIIGLFISSPAITSDFNDNIDKIFSTIEQQSSPGCNVGVIKEGSFIHKTGYGLASLELNVPLDGKQVHRMASVSKQFTAMAVLLLAEEGGIDLDANISTYLKAGQQHDYFL